MKHGAAYFDLSTNSRATVRKINAAFAEKGAYMFDAPVSGGPRGAKTGKLAIWVGGDRSVFERHKGVLGAMGAATYGIKYWRPEVQGQRRRPSDRLRRPPSH